MLWSVASHFIPAGHCRSVSTCSCRVFVVCLSVSPCRSSCFCFFSCVRFLSVVVRSFVRRLSDFCRSFVRSLLSRVVVSWYGFVSRSVRRQSSTGLFGVSRQFVLSAVSFYRFGSFILSVLRSASSSARIGSSSSFGPATIRVQLPSANTPAGRPWHGVLVEK